MTFFLGGQSNERGTWKGGDVAKSFKKSKMKPYLPLLSNLEQVIKTKLKKCSYINISY